MTGILSSFPSLGASNTTPLTPALSRGEREKDGPLSLRERVRVRAESRAPSVVLGALSLASCERVPEDGPEQVTLLGRLGFDLLLEPGVHLRLAGMPLRFGEDRLNARDGHRISGVGGDQLGTVERAGDLVPAQLCRGGDLGSEQAQGSGPGGVILEPPGPVDAASVNVGEGV